MKSSRVLLSFLLLAASVSAASITWDQPNANNNWNTTDANWTGGATFVNGDSVTFNSATGETVLVDASGVAPVSTSVSSAGNWTFAIGSISGTLDKSGAGTLTLSSANGFSSVSVAGGNLSLGNTGALGANTVTFGTGTSTGTAATAMLVTTALTTSSTIPNAITLPSDTANSNRGLYMYGVGNGTNTLELSGKISGGSSLTTLFLNNDQVSATNPQVIFSNSANDFIAKININRGGIRIASNEALGDPTNIVVFDSNGGADLTFLSALTYTHATTLNTATDFDTGSNAVTASGVIRGVAGFTKIGSGTLTLNNTNTYLGATTVNAGTLQLDGTSPPRHPPS